MSSSILAAVSAQLLSGNHSKIQAAYLAMLLERQEKKNWAWVRYLDTKTKVAYYYNIKTGATTWNEPDNYVTEKSFSYETKEAR